MLTGRLQFDPETDACLRKAFLKPHPRITEGQLLVEQGVKTAIDISDGLISDLKHICRASKVSARIEAELLPIRPSVRANFGEKSLELALAGGEDYELLFTGSAEVIEKIKKAASCPVTVIGEITTGEHGITVVNSQGQPVELDRAGWDHFSRA
jgi:thiamine-monophosphate kinase